MDYSKTLSEITIKLSIISSTKFETEDSIEHLIEICSMIVGMRTSCEAELYKSFLGIVSQTYLLAKTVNKIHKNKKLNDVILELGAIMAFYILEN